MVETKLKSQALEVDELRAPSTSHLTLTPGSNKLVKVAVLRQDDTTNAYKNNQVILTGWGYKVGNGTRDLEDAVSFGITFLDVPIVLVSGVLYSTSVPTSLSDLIFGNNDRGGIATAGPKSISTTGFTASMAAESTITFATTEYYGYTWIAIGTL